MTVINVLPIILLGVGAVIIWISFTNEENVTGLWVAGKDFRDKQFKESERFKRRTYTIIKLVGILLVISGCLIEIFAK
jgi:uncharacterized Tic20 family protein